jgi:hypothetical protein
MVGAISPMYNVRLLGIPQLTPLYNECVLIKMKKKTHSKKEMSIIGKSIKTEN